MGLKTRKLTRREGVRLYRFPCDGIHRYLVKGFDYSMPYGEAYDAIFNHSGSSIENDPATGRSVRIFRGDAMKRISNLNARYYNIAKEFINQELDKKRKQEQDAKPTGIDNSVDNGGVQGGQPSSRAGGGSRLPANQEGGSG